MSVKLWVMYHKRYKIIFPETGRRLEQDEEYITVDFEGRREKMRLHDYSRIYQVPGLYEEIFQQHLMCRSPWIIGDMLADAMADRGFSLGLLETIARRRRPKGTRGELVARPTRVYRDVRGPKEVSLEPSILKAEQSNTSVVYGDRFILKLFRRLHAGVNPFL